MKRTDAIPKPQRSSASCAAATIAGWFGEPEVVVGAEVEELAAPGDARRAAPAASSITSSLLRARRPRSSASLAREVVAHCAVHRHPASRPVEDHLARARPSAATANASSKSVYEKRCVITGEMSRPDWSITVIWYQVSYISRP